MIAFGESLPHLVRDELTFVDVGFGFFVIYWTTMIIGIQKIENQICLLYILS